MPNASNSSLETCRPGRLLAAILGSLLLFALMAAPLSAAGLAQHRRGPAFSSRPRAWRARPVQRRKLGSALERLHRLPLDQQIRRLQNDPGFQRLPPQRQQRMIDRLRWFNSLPPRKQRRVLTRLRHLGELSPGQRQGLMRVFQAWKTYPPEQRRGFRRAFHQLNRMSPGQQQQALASSRFSSRFPPQEIGLLRQALALHLPQDVIGSRPPGKPAQ